MKWGDQFRLRHVGTSISRSMTEYHLTATGKFLKVGKHQVDGKEELFIGVSEDHLSEDTKFCFQPFKQVQFTTNEVTFHSRKILCRNIRPNCICTTFHMIVGYE